MLLAAAVKPAQATLLIDVGEVALLPDRPGQVVDFYLLNDGADVSVAGLAFNIQVADTGPSSRGGFGSISGPSITGLDLISGTLFEPNHRPVAPSVGIPQFAYADIVTAAGSLTIPGGQNTKLASVTFDTTGFPEGLWPLYLGDTVNGPTMFYASDATKIAPSIGDGALRISRPSTVPDVHSTMPIFAIALFALVALDGVRSSIHSKTLTRSAGEKPMAQ